MEDRLLTPAEAALIAEPGASAAGKCVRGAMLMLAAAGQLVVEQSEGWFPHPLLSVVEPPPGAPPLPDHVAEVRRVLRLRGVGKRMKWHEAAGALSQAFGSDYARYVHERVAPGLIRRGLLRRIDERVFFGLFPRIRYERTAKGDALAAPIIALIARLEEMPRLIKRDPEAALRLAREAGVLLILSPAARGKIDRLRKLFAAQDRTGDGGGASFAFAGNSGDQDGIECAVGVEFGDLSLAMEFGDMLDTVDAMCDADGGGGDGGDGGGGGGD